MYKFFWLSDVEVKVVVHLEEVVLGGSGVAVEEFQDVDLEDGLVEEVLVLLDLFETVGSVGAGLATLMS